MGFPPLGFKVVDRRCPLGDDGPGLAVQCPNFAGLVVVVADEIDFLVFALFFAALLGHKLESPARRPFVQDKRVRPHVCELVTWLCCLS